MEKPKCAGCGTTKGLYFFPRNGLFLCEPCADKTAEILRLCRGGITLQELKFRLRLRREEAGVSDQNE